MDSMNRIFDWIDQLSQIDVPEMNETAVDATMSATERTDVPLINNTRDELMSNTKHEKFGLFCTPKIVE
jgi:aspartyl/glutamyl-tRNA(Asn/Gln) amidotransferase C subunit